MRKSATIYNKQTGKILRSVTCSEQDIVKNIGALGPELAFLEGASIPSRDKVVSGQIVRKSVQDIKEEQHARELLLQPLRQAEVQELRTKSVAVRAKYPEVLDLLIDLDILPEALR